MLDEKWDDKNVKNLWGPWMFSNLMGDSEIFFPWSCALKKERESIKCMCGRRGGEGLFLPHIQSNRISLSHLMKTSGNPIYITSDCSYLHVRINVPLSSHHLLRFSSFPHYCTKKTGNSQTTKPKWRTWPSGLFEPTEPLQVQAGLLIVKRRRRESCILLLLGWLWGFGEKEKKEDCRRPDGVKARYYRPPQGQQQMDQTSHRERENRLREKDGRKHGT